VEAHLDSMKAMLKRRVLLQLAPVSWQLITNTIALARFS